MKKPLFIVLFLAFCGTANAQKTDTTIYEGCTLINITSNPARRHSLEGLNPDPINIINVCAHFPGGDKAFYKFLAKNLNWPKTNQDVQGKVWMSFVVEKNGRLTNITVLRRLSPLFDAEAVRAMEHSPRWIPGKINGKPIRVRYILPISFIINE